MNTNTPPKYPAKHTKSVLSKCSCGSANSVPIIHNETTETETYPPPPIRIPKVDENGDVITPTSVKPRMILKQGGVKKKRIALQYPRRKVKLTKSNEA